MLAGHIVERGRIELVDVPEPELTDRRGEIIFEPSLACLCGSDIPFFDSGDDADYPRDPGHSLHEMIGTVVATSGKRYRPGDRVLAVPVQQRGFFERYVLDEDRAIPLDPRPRPEHALMAQPLGTAIYALRKLPPLIGLDVAIVGQGPMGQIFCAAVRNLGARRIIAMDRLAERLDASTRMGATHIVNSQEEDPVAALHRITDGIGADIVVEAVGHREICLNLCAELCRHSGQLLSFGVPPESPVDGVEWRELFFKNIVVKTSVNPDFEFDFPLAMQWIAEGRIDLTPLITHRFPLTKIQEAFELFRDRQDGAIKVLLDFPVGE